MIRTSWWHGIYDWNHKTVKHRMILLATFITGVSTNARWRDGRVAVVQLVFLHHFHVPLERIKRCNEILETIPIITIGKKCWRCFDWSVNVWLIENIMCHTYTRSIGNIHSAFPSAPGPVLQTSANVWRHAQATLRASSLMIVCHVRTYVFIQLVESSDDSLPSERPLPFLGACLVYRHCACAWRAHQRRCRSLWWRWMNNHHHLRFWR